ncbi:PREDICTED: ceruloplasmin-like [Nanorana parkeri]|uniref:ceruloplasmin-like n=1 Tax=Nanorana parkeri TaxID=125878 RepID=UPI000854B0D7|nr:PREDICTED: ceruloplasmin-like [Nanorana parkeri]
MAAGVLEKKKKKTEEYVLMLSVIDENLSWYIDDNINSYCTDPASVDKEDEGFTESNLKHSINGYMFGNLPGLSVCDNTDVMWYIFAVGNEIDVHSIYFYGHVLTYQHRRVDTISLISASMVQASMLTHNPGKWLVTSQVNEHLEGGMQAIYEVRNCSKLGPPSQYQSTVRRYYIAALEIIWNYGPTSINQFTGQKLDAPGSDSAKYFEQNDLRIGGSYMKAVYREFTDSTFTKEKPRSQNEIHLGILGPVIRAQVGDTIEVIFKNNASHPYSIQVHGVNHRKDMEGAVYKTGNIVNGQSRPSHVAPGDTVTYQWKVPDSVAPTSEDLNCIAWLYYSSVDPVKDTNSGLVGPLLVCNKLTSTNQTGADYDFVMMPTVFDENKSWYLQDNINRFAGKPESVNVNYPDFVASNNMHSINGYVLLLGGSVACVFNVECMTTDHYTSGIRQHYRVNACGWILSGSEPENALEVSVGDERPRSPVEKDGDCILITRSTSLSLELHGDVFLNQTNTTIGSIYKKVVYRGYTDQTFARRMRRTEDETHLGILGPILYCNVGDKVKVIFMNKAHRTYSIYAHGLKPENKQTKPTEPGNIEVYTWNVPKRSGPNIDETDCLTWAYYSDVDQVKDTYSGLIGTIVVCKRSYNQLEAPDLRLVLLFMVFDENKSWYLDENIQKYCLNPSEVDKNSDAFRESNMMHSINGRMYGNTKLIMNVGDHVVWHVMGMGNEVDIHTAHWHGHSMKFTRGRKLQTDIFELLPGTFQTASMIARRPGTWLLHCHVDDHLYAGMVTVYTVKDRTSWLQLFAYICDPRICRLLAQEFTVRL